ncbi:uncharacterized protein si:cabz01074946.1 isoform X3 [Neoarius graeffei]|uniref:uncharacterized protein si:cabz01074946.1 isoform X3 n=1 Tax=Neoarius graeffei TaxID=443677 RepID=UPI00298C248C|nr:uncharacterized protein si:cabz01074946.1 isoform X3 [Neoarius graeffei]
MKLECVSIPVMCLVVFFHQGVGGEDVRSVTGYTKESVVLPSGADSSWTLKRIRWSIYENVTYIAVFQNGKESVDRSPLFTKRLELNKTSGDLTIKNVSSRDALRYSVELLGQNNERKTSYVQLSVEEQLGKPSIRLLHNILDAEKCVISLECQRTSENGQISFSWKAENFNDTPFWDSPAESGKSVLWTTVKRNRTVTFSCIAAAGNRSQSCSKNVTCKEAPGNSTQPEDSKICCKRSDEKVVVGFCALVFGVALGFLLSLGFRYKYKASEQLISPPDHAGEPTSHGEARTPEATGGDKKTDENIPSETDPLNVPGQPDPKLPKMDDVGHSDTAPAPAASVPVHGNDQKEDEKNDDGGEARGVSAPTATV